MSIFSPDVFETPRAVNGLHINDHYPSFVRKGVFLRIRDFNFVFSLSILDSTVFKIRNESADFCYRNGNVGAENTMVLVGDVTRVERTS